ncbi:MAG: hypothetical protein JRI66_13150, partial [Deltaproteobacteria bacterium]|nr:hypothetical protein [Deltaproteobacteria bacterium]
RLVEKAYHRAHEILEARREALEKVAKVLLEKEVLEGEELRRLLNEQTPQT